MTHIAPSLHSPVLLNEVLYYLAPKDGEVIIDGTFGGGGYSKAILESSLCVVKAVDRDLEAVERGREFEKKYPDRFSIIEGRFGAMDDLFSDRIGKIDGIALDIGVSSYQLDQRERGFSFRFDGPLDMRMSQKATLSAADVVNTYKEKDLADIIYRYGEERHSRAIARKIVLERQKQPVTTTLQLAEVVRSVVRSAKHDIDPATKTFQALRIYVNDELGELERGLLASEKLLAEGGRLVVVSFHSLEDRIVKQFMQKRSGKASQGSRHSLGATKVATQAEFKLLTKNVVRPSDEESRRNPRARSARLRALMKLKIAKTTKEV